MRLFNERGPKNPLEDRAAEALENWGRKRIPNAIDDYRVKTPKQKRRAIAVDAAAIERVRESPAGKIRERRWEKYLNRRKQRAGE